MTAPLIGLIMGSQSDWATLRKAAELLDALGIPHETKIVSAHRTPERLYAYANSAAARGLKVIIAGAGGAAHLPGMAASMTTLPVLGVPIESKALKGMDSLLSIVQMPAVCRWPRLRSAKAAPRTRRSMPRRFSRCRIRRWPDDLRPGARSRRTPSPRTPSDNRAMTSFPSRGTPVRPGGTIGILGGGQLGRMLALAAARLGLKTPYFFRRRRRAGLSGFRRAHAGPLIETTALARFRGDLRRDYLRIRECPRRDGRALAPLKPFHPNARALAVAQDRLDEKTFVAGWARDGRLRGGDTPPTRKRAGANRHARDLKTRRLGYDGKGQAKVANAADAAGGLRRASRVRRRSSKASSTSRFEASVIAARGATAASQPMIRRRICTPPHPARSTVPSRLTEAQMRRQRNRAAHRRCARLCRRVRGRAVRRHRTARCSSTRSRRACTIPGTGRSKPAPSASSSSIFAPWPAGRSAILRATPMP